MDTAELMTLLDRIIHDCKKAKAELLNTGDSAVPGFDEFWKLYPKKDDEAAARHEWRVTVRHEDAKKILSVLKRAAWPDQARFIPSPRRWLLLRRWQTQKTREDNGKYQGISEEL
jgi:PHP family Zn ribbon phosphoesterase